MEIYSGKSVFYADLHNHCGISYGHGALEDALNNARQRLDICSITGHAHWPDMPPRDGRIDRIIDFHEEGFAKLKEGWQADLEVMRRFDRDGSFLVFPGYEIHSMASGDYTIVARDLDARIIYPDSIEALSELLRSDPALLARLLPFPHHIGYKRGRRGINWDHFSGDLFPLVEIFSMHGCAEEDENDRPFLHTMGPLDGRGTMQYGLTDAGARFGVVANTDHHSAHPGSYGHGMTAVWADGLDRQSIWDALKQRHTYALSADKMMVAFLANGAPMGSVGRVAGKQRLEFDVTAGGALDYVDIIRNGRLFRRFSAADAGVAGGSGTGRDGLQTILYFEAGWGERGVSSDWEVTIDLEGAEIGKVDARFRGDEVVSPLDAAEERAGYFRSSWEQRDGSGVALRLQTRSNPTNSTPATQGIALEVAAGPDAIMHCSVNGKEHHIPVRDLLESSYVGYLGGFDSPAFKVHRAPLEPEFHWRATVEDIEREPAFYYLRVRQKNGARAWSSPVWIE